MEVPSPEKQVFTVPEIAEILRTTPAYVRRELIGKKRIRYIRVTKNIVRVPVSAITEFLAGEGGRSTP